MNVFIALKGSHFWFYICIRTHLEIQEDSMLYNLSSIQKHQEQIYPCHKKGQGQARVFIWKKNKNKKKKNKNKNKQGMVGTCSGAF